MAYSTLDNIKKLLPETAIIQLTDDENTGSVNTPRVNEAIAQADAEIESYCGGKYNLPFSPVPDIIRKCSVDIAIYNLYSRKVETIPETRAERYKNAIRQLGDIAKGIITVGALESNVVSNDSGILATTTNDDRVFTKTNLANY